MPNSETSNVEARLDWDDGVAAARTRAGPTPPSTGVEIVPK
jgi:hypothetical protein